ncbi:MAG TPA: flagellar hook-basal body complex protein [Acidobacteriaceae bacterium]|nr:flagellar hook-basal body complex protein [Acidobacteriaceae bacterium]
MSSFSIPLTGLKASSTQLNTIANNLSNMNTTAFKSQSVTFSDLFYQQIGTTGSGDPQQVGAGTRVAATVTDFSQGGINSTGNASDLYINGNGFFVVQDNNGTTELTRDGNFTISGGCLVTQDGQNVMGYPAANGAVNTSAQLAPIQLPVGQVENARATTSMSMTANLNASDAVGTTVLGQVPIYDSLGNPHEATVYFTKTGTNTWSYNFSLDPKPLTDTSSATTRTIADTVSATTRTLADTVSATTRTVTTSASGGNTTIPFDAGTTVDPTTSFTIDDGSTTVTAPAATNGESLSTYLTALQTALTNGGSTATASLTGNTLTITGGTITGSVVEGGVTRNSFTLNSGATVDPTTSFTINDGTTTVTAPAATSGESLATYLTALQTALTNAGSTATASVSGSTLTITGGTITGNVVEGSIAQNTFALDRGGTMDPSTSFTINDGVTTVTAPAATSGESLSTYLTALQTALTNAGSTATASLNGSTLTVTGGAITGTVVEGGITTYAYNIDAGTTIDPSTSLTITGTNGGGNSTTITAPPIAPGETLNSYATALTAAIGNANIQGVVVSVNGNGLSISGPGISLGGNLLESAAGTASGNATGSLTFDTNGNLIAPSTNVVGIQLGGLTDGASNLSLTWDLFGASGAGLITQSAVGTSASSNPVTGTIQDGYASGSYQGFSVDSSGVVSATFSNGKTQVVGQVALANVANLQGLTIEAGNNYATTTASGPATVGIAGTGGLGTLQEKALEGANVDIATQFANLIVAQQAFQASSKAITTFDTISQDTINMIH